MKRYYLKGRQGDAVNATLAAVGYDFTLLLAWLGLFLRLLQDWIAGMDWRCGENPNVALPLGGVVQAF